MTWAFRLVSLFLPVPHFQLLFLPVFIFALFSNNHSCFSSHLDVMYSALASSSSSASPLSSVLPHHQLQHFQVCFQHLKIWSELMECSLSLSVSRSFCLCPFSFLSLFLSVLLSLTSQCLDIGSNGFFSLCGYLCPLGANQIE